MYFRYAIFHLSVPPLQCSQSYRNKAETPRILIFCLILLQIKQELGNSIVINTRPTAPLILNDSTHSEEPDWDDKGAEKYSRHSEFRLGNVAVLLG